MAEAKGTYEHLWLQIDEIFKGFVLMQLWNTKSQRMLQFQSCQPNESGSTYRNYEVFIKLIEYWLDCCVGVSDCLQWKINWKLSKEFWYTCSPPLRQGFFFRIFLLFLWWRSSSRTVFHSIFTVFVVSWYKIERFPCDGIISQWFSSKTFVRFWNSCFLANSIGACFSSSSTITA